VSDFVIGIDLGGTNLKTAILSRDKQLLAKESRPTNAGAGPDAVIDAMEASAREVAAAAGASLDSVLAVGVGAPGPLNWQSGIIYSLTNMPGWSDVPLARILSERLGTPCFLENDANAACYGEYWLGAGQGADNMAVLTLGTGVGGGVVVFGKLLRGIDGTAAELGHLKVMRDGRPCGCGARGCLETYASVTGMTMTAVEGLETFRTSRLLEMSRGDIEQLDGKMIFDAAREGDALALWAFRETATWLGIGIASIINYQNPEKVVLCGGMVAAGDMLLDTVREVAKANCFPVPGARCEILTAGLGGDSGVIGAAGCALDRCLDTTRG